MKFYHILDFCWSIVGGVVIFGASVVNVGLGRQRRRLSLYINKAPLCENGRGLRTHQSCDLGFEGCKRTCVVHIKNDHILHIFGQSWGWTGGTGEVAQRRLW